MTASPRPLRVYGHRGASRWMPENTLDAFRRAVQDGADAVETDVHVTRDGHVVVCHDEDGRRMAGVRRAVRDATLDEVRGWDAARGFVDPEGRPHAGPLRLPTLDEALQAFPDLPINVDIKPPDARAVPPVLEVLARRGAEARVTLASFHDRVMAEVRRLGYRGGVSLAQREAARVVFSPGWMLRRFPPRGTALQIPARLGALRFDRADLVARCHAHGLRVDYWVIDDPAEARRLLALGADGIVTNDPAAIVPVVKEERARRTGG